MVLAAQQGRLQDRIARADGTGNAVHDVDAETGLRHRLDPSVDALEGEARLTRLDESFATDRSTHGAGRVCRPAARAGAQRPRGRRPATPSAVVSKWLTMLVTKRSE